MNQKQTIIIIPLIILMGFLAFVAYDYSSLEENQIIPSKQDPPIPDSISPLNITGKEANKICDAITVQCDQDIRFEAVRYPDKIIIRPLINDVWYYIEINQTKICYHSTDSTLHCKNFHSSLLR